MKVIISKDKKTGKVVYKYQSYDGLIFTVKDHCLVYENKWKKPKKPDQKS